MIRRSATDGLRFLTYLSPGLPVEIFEAVAARVGFRLGLPASLAVEPRLSGPAPGDEDPFSRDEADVGFMCAPPFIWLADLVRSPVELLGVAPVFDDPRTGGEPVYFSDMIVHRQSPFGGFGELLGKRWAYNDDCSLSGYYSLLQRFAEVAEEGDPPPRLDRSGSHLHSIELVATGRTEAAVIDSNVLALRLAAEPGLRSRLRVVESLGPYPVQPIAVRSALDHRLKAGAREALLSWPRSAAGRRELSALGLRGFAPVDDAHYAPERAALAACASLYPGAVASARRSG